jgi:DNA processing protein
MNKKSWKISQDSPDYPKELHQLYSPPAELYLLGKPIKSEPRVAIVGSRRCSSYGRNTAEELAANLAQLGLTIVSGMACGIDAAAHSGALKARGKTIAVLGCGVDVIYPKCNRQLYENLKRNATIISEHRDGTPPFAQHFPARNRIIAGLSSAVIVVEASARSGSLITVEFALEQGKEVMAIPGHIKSPISQGCHKLIKQGAALIESAEDVLEILDIEVKESSRKMGRSEKLSELEMQLLDKIGFEPTDLDQIVAHSNLPTAQVSATISILEVKGYVRQESGGRYLRSQ